MGLELGLGLRLGLGLELGLGLGLGLGFGFPDLGEEAVRAEHARGGDVDHADVRLGEG